MKTINQKRDIKNYKAPNSILESVDTIVIIGATSISITFSITGIGFNILPISAGIACSLSLRNKKFLKMIINENNKHKKHDQKDQQAFESFDKLYR